MKGLPFLVMGIALNLIGFYLLNVSTTLNSETTYAVITTLMCLIFNAAGVIIYYGGVSRNNR